ncbi:MAG: hypothetical protein NE328_00290 [Lentisphaeraceae bacterium]|nr:hypothetical protein [Lentisphaeraceae bacterium]
MRNQVGKWLPEIWKKSGGVITQRDAACIIGISDQSVKLAGDKGAIQYYECENVRRYSFNDCILYKTTREDLLERKKIEETIRENPKKVGISEDLIKNMDETEKEQYISHLMMEYDIAQNKKKEEQKDMQFMAEEEYERSGQKDYDDHCKEIALEKRIQILEKIIMKDNNTKS